MSDLPIILATASRQGHAEGERYDDLCAAPASCSACSMWPLTGESRADWLARLGAIHRADMADTTKYVTNTRRSA